MPAEDSSCRSTCHRCFTTNSFRGTPPKSRMNRPARPMPSSPRCCRRCCRKRRHPRTLARNARNCLRVRVKRLLKWRSSALCLQVGTFGGSLSDASTSLVARVASFHNILNYLPISLCMVRIRLQCPKTLSNLLLVGGSS